MSSSLRKTYPGSLLQQAPHPVHLNLRPSLYHMVFLNRKVGFSQFNQVVGALFSKGDRAAIRDKESPFFFKPVLMPVPMEVEADTGVGVKDFG